MRTSWGKNAMALVIIAGAAPYALAEAVKGLEKRAAEAPSHSLGGFGSFIEHPQNSFSFPKPLASQKDAGTTGSMGLTGPMNAFRNQGQQTNPFYALMAQGNAGKHASSIGVGNNGASAPENSRGFANHGSNAGDFADFSDFENKIKPAQSSRKESTPGPQENSTPQEKRVQFSDPVHTSIRMSGSRTEGRLGAAKHHDNIKSSLSNGAQPKQPRLRSAASLKANGWKSVSSWNDMEPSTSNDINPLTDPTEHSSSGKQSKRRGGRGKMSGFFNRFRPAKQMRKPSRGVMKKWTGGMFSKFNRRQKRKQYNSFEQG